MERITFSGIVAEVNSIADHVWAIILTVVGAVMVALKHTEAGQMLVGGGLALFKGHNDSQTPDAK